MFRKIVVIVLIMMLMSLGTAFADDNYPYKSVCPEGDRYFDGTDGLVCDGSDCFFKDRWGFAQCNCTSYAAHRLNEHWKTIAPSSDIEFWNQYHLDETDSVCRNLNL